MNKKIKLPSFMCHEAVTEHYDKYIVLLKINLEAIQTYI